MVSNRSIIHTMPEAVRRPKSNVKSSGTAGRSMLGVQHDSRKTSSPVFGFGSADRNALARVFISVEHCRADFGKVGPGAGTYFLYFPLNTFRRTDCPYEMSAVHFVRLVSVKSRVTSLEE